MLETLRSLVRPFFGAIGAIASGTFGRQSPVTGMASLLMICAIFASLTPTASEGSTRAMILRKMAPRVQPFVERHFAAIDKDGNGVIIEAELKQALNSLGLGKEEMATLQHITDELSEIGHVIDSYTTTRFIAIALGNSGTMMMPRKTTQNVYGISAEDVPGYQARVIEKYKHW